MSSFLWLSGFVRAPHRGAKWFRKLNPEAYHVMRVSPIERGDMHIVELRVVWLRPNVKNAVLLARGWDYGNAAETSLIDEHNRLIAKGTASVTTMLVDAASSDDRLSEVLRAYTGTDCETLRTRLRRLSTQTADRVPSRYAPTHSTQELLRRPGHRATFTRCPDCGEASCGPACPSLT